MRLNNTEWLKMRELSVVVKLHDLQHRVAGNIPQVPENEFMPRLPETAVVKLQDSSVPLVLITMVVKLHVLQLCDSNTVPFVQ